ATHLPRKSQKQKTLLHAFASLIQTHHCREQYILPRFADLKISLDTETLSKKLACPSEAMGTPPISSREFSPLMMLWAAPLPARQCHGCGCELVFAASAHDRFWHDPVVSLCDGMSAAGES